MTEIFKWQNDKSTVNVLASKDPSSSSGVERLALAGTSTGNILQRLILIITGIK